MATFTAKSADSGKVLSYRKVTRNGRNRNTENLIAAFGDDEPNGFKLAVQACAENGGGIVETNEPLEPSGESVWAVEGDGSYKPIKVPAAPKK